MDRRVHSKPEMESISTGFLRCRDDLVQTRRRRIFRRRSFLPTSDRGTIQVSHCWHLHQLGWTFRALPAAFLVDLPHPPTEHRKVHETNPALRASVDGLFMRFVAEIERSIAVVEQQPLSSTTSSAPAAAARAGLASARSKRRESLNGDDRNRVDYEVLEDLSLVAWGRAWAAAGANHGGGGSGGGLELGGGGGWELKGGPSAWEGLRAGRARDRCEDEDVVRHRGSERDCVTVPRGVSQSDRDGVAVPSRMVGGWAEVSIGPGIHGRSVIHPRTNHGVMRYWVHPRWDPSESPRGKLPGLGMSGDVRFFVRWHSGSVGFCSLMMLGQPLTDVCEVHMVRQAPFSLEHGKTTAIQLEADARRTPANGGCLTFRAWANGSVVYEARVYAGDAVLSGDEDKGMGVEDALLHVMAASANGGGGDATATEHVLVGGIEVWARYDPPQSEEVVVARERDRCESFVRKGGGNELVLRDGVNGSQSSTGKLRFVFVARCEHSV